MPVFIGTGTVNYKLSVPMHLDFNILQFSAKNGHIEKSENYGNKAKGHILGMQLQTDEEQLSKVSGDKLEMLRTESRTSTTKCMLY